MLLTIRSASVANLCGRLGSVEIFDVERPHGDLIATGGRGRLPRQRIGDDGRRRLRLHPEVAEVEVEDAVDRAPEPGADVDQRHAAARVQLEHLVVDEDSLGVEVVLPNDDPASIRAHRGAGAVVGQHPDLAKVVGGGGDDGLVDAHEHVLERLVEVDAVVCRIEDAAVLDAAQRVVLDDRVRPVAAAAADHDGRRQGVALRDDA